tara:strand:- start:134 stop:421 length:288 start_codon:yes stop_codon:yes gene_type:complete
MTNKFRERYHKNINDVSLLNYLREFNTYKNYSINNIKKINNTLVGDIKYYNRSTNKNYMDETIRDFTKVLSEELRDVAGKNIYYDIDKGKIIFQI